jgi:hypothetical protein
MDLNRLQPELQSRLLPASPNHAGRDAQGIQSASLGAVLFEQLEYLVAHDIGHCSPECLDCARLQQVQHWLLLPFRDPPYAAC